MKKMRSLVLAASLTLLLTSCSFFSSREVSTGEASRQVTREYFSQMLFNKDGLSFEAENFLRGNLIFDTFESNPVAALQKINEYYQISNNPDYFSIAADLCRLKAVRSEPDVAIRYYLSAFYYNRRSMRERVTNKTFDNGQKIVGSYRQLMIYNEACYGLFTYLHDRGLLDHDSFELLDAEGRKFTFAPSDYHLSLPREQIADFLPCADYQINDLFQKDMRLGAGLPLIGVVKEKEKKPGDVTPALRIPTGLTIPVTMLAFFDENPDHSFTVRTRFLDTFLRESFQWQDKDLGTSVWPLALDFSTPLAYFLGSIPEQNLISLMVHPDAAEEATGLYMLEPYQPDKIPVVFVHGLMSSPNTWSQMINSLRNDPVIRQKYQFWFYYYSSGVPVPLSGKKLLDTLYNVQKELCKTDAEKKNFDNMVIVGHSMGGLITRTLIQADPHMLAAGLAGQPWKEMTKDLTSEDIARLDKMLSYPALPTHRVIFMAVPHRGSMMAKWSIARFGSWLVTFPVSIVSGLVTLKDIFKDNHKLLPEINQNYTGLDNLDPDSRFMRGLKKTAIKPDVIYHSIIGDQRGDDLLGGSDGVVPYWSSHLDGAASEMVVQSGHSVHRQPAAIREVMRILLLHLKENK